MSDDIQLNIGTGGDKSRAKDRTSSKTSIFGLDIGISGTETLLNAGAAASAASVPVVIATDQSLASATATVNANAQFAQITLPAGAKSVTLNFPSGASINVGANLNFVGSYDGTTWDNLGFPDQPNLQKVSGNAVAQVAQTGVGNYRFIAISVSGWSSGTAAIAVYASNMPYVSLLTQRGQKAAANCMPVVLASDVLASIATIDVTNGGNITTQNLNPLTGTPTAGSTIQVITAAGQTQLSIEVTGTYTGALSLQLSGAGTTFVTNTDATAVINKATGARSATIPSATPGIYEFNTAGSEVVRVSALAAVTGTAVVRISLGRGSHQVIVEGTSLVDTELPAAAALADGASNPTTPSVGAMDLAFNGTTWDRTRNNFNTTTGDTGAKSTTGNGATQTNFNAKGAMIAFNVGAFSGGTSPTITFKLQWSADSGTTFVDLAGAVTSAIAATSVAALTIYPGVAAVANSAVSSSIPRTWRVVWTITGAPTGITITNIQVAYVN